MKRGERMRSGIGLVIASVVMVTGCASSAGTTAPFKPEGASGPTAASTTASTATVSFPFGADVHFQFQTPLPGDPDEQAAVVADRNFQLAYYYAIYSGGSSKAVYQYIPASSTSIRTDVFTSVSSQRGTTFTGTLLIYRTTVSATPGASGDLTVTSCFDSAKQTTLNRSTHQPLPGQNQIPQDNMFTESDTWMPVNGGWKLSAIVHQTYPHGAAKGCYPL